MESLPGSNLYQRDDNELHYCNDCKQHLEAWPLGLHRLRLSGHKCSPLAALVGTRGLWGPICAGPRARHQAVPESKSTPAVTSAAPSNSPLQPLHRQPRYRDLRSQNLFELGDDYCSAVPIRPTRSLNIEQPISRNTHLLYSSRGLALLRWMGN